MNTIYLCPNNGATSLFIYCDCDEQKEVGKSTAIHSVSTIIDQQISRQAESWQIREVDLVRGFPFVSEFFFLRESYE